MRFSFVVAAALPLLARLTSTLAQPISLESDELAARYDEELDVRDSGFDFAEDYSLREIDDYLDAILEARAKGAPYAVKTKKKVSAADQKARKDAVKTKVANNQAHNAQKKKTLQKKAETAPRYGKPRSAGKQKPNQPGYRAKGRASGNRLAKQPKTPKPNMKKGDPRSAKSETKQAAANQRTKNRKAAGVKKFADTKAKYKKTTSMPNRKATFTANGSKWIYLIYAGVYSRIGSSFQTPLPARMFVPPSSTRITSRVERTRYNSASHSFVSRLTFVISSPLPSNSTTTNKDPLVAGTSLSPR